MNSKLRTVREVAYLNLSAIHESLASDFHEALDRVLDSSAFSGGAEVADFESDFARFLGVTECIGCSSGSSALVLALESLGVGPGDEVVVPCNSFVASAEAVRRTGATPVFCDVDRQSYLMDLKSVASKVGPRTRAVIPVHLHGNVVDIPKLRMAIPPEVLIVEDAAQAHGGGLGGLSVGSMGDMAAFSFYPGKNLGALGEAGAVTTNSRELAAQARLRRSWGERERYVHSIPAFNERMDGLQGAFLSIKLRHFPAWEEFRKMQVGIYLEALKGIQGVNLPDNSNPDRVWHIFAPAFESRTRLREHLSEAGIQTAIHYPFLIPLQPSFGPDFGQPEDFPVGLHLAETILSLPLGPHLKQADLEYVIDVVVDFYV
jgi:dTDP-4-amino-4,6-dideoxygalactose transaminase